MLPGQAVVEKKVLSFLNQRNRPYTLQVVADNLAHQKLTKKMVEQALKSLADDGKITRKACPTLRTKALNKSS